MNWDLMTVAEARKILREKAREPDGCICCVCKQNVKVYRRKFNRTMAKFLVEMYKVDEEGIGWLHVASSDRILQITRGAGDFAKSRYWDLIEQRFDLVGGKKVGSGDWRITQKGREFVEGKITIEKYAFVYNKHCLGFSEGEPLSIRQALGEKYDYEEMMGMAPRKVEGRLF